MRCKFDDLKSNLIGLEIGSSEIQGGKITDVCQCDCHPYIEIVIDGWGWIVYRYRTRLISAIKNAIQLRRIERQRKCDAKLMI